MEQVTYKRSKTTDFFYKINVIAYIFGLPNFWIEDLKFSKRFIEIYNRIAVVSNIMTCVWLLFEYGAFVTQDNLSKKQQYNFWFDVIFQTIVCIYCFILTHHKNTVRAAFYNLSVALKIVHNDHKVERFMIASTKMYITAFILTGILAMVMRTFATCLDMVQNNATFTTIITAYPDVKDHSSLANVSRGICYLLCWFFLLRVFATYTLVLSLTISLSHQYQNLQSYFYSLNGIFERNNLTQKQKEYMYEKQFKVGIQLHSDTMRCTTQCQTVCGSVFSGQIVMNLLGILVLLVQMVEIEHNLSNLCTTLLTAVALLISTGFIMWNAGDVTVEAANLPTAIYSSGWENCQGNSSIRIRKLVTITMNDAQQPVVLKGLGYIELSYQSYITIVKASYSVFSVLA